jgi:hypothetical protein
VGMSLGPSCLIRPSFSRLGGAEANAEVQETLPPGDSVRQEATVPALNGYGSKG